MAGSATISGLPAVRLEVHQAGRSVPYFFDQVDFLIGTVAGCDLRLPGANLPAVLCLLARHPDGLTLRRLAVTQLLLLNGAPASRAELKDGDRLTFGTLDVYVRLEATAALAEVDAEPIETSPPAAEAAPAPITGDLLQRELAVSRQEEELTRRRQQLDVQAAELDKARLEIAGIRQEVADIRRQLHERYQERRDRLAGLQEAVDRAARKVQEGKRELEQRRLEYDQREEALARRTAELERERVTLEDGRGELDELRRAWDESQAGEREEAARSLADVTAREARLTAQEQALEARERLYQADVVRLDRRQGDIEQRERQLADREAILTARERQLVADSGDLEQQAQELDLLRTQLEDESDALAKRSNEQDALDAQLQERATSLEGQQTALAALRGRLERMRDEFRIREQEFEAQRLVTERTALETTQRQQELERQEQELAAQSTAAIQERQQLAERQTVLAEAVARLKEAQDRIAQDQTKLAGRAHEVELRLTGVAEKEALLQGRLDQLAEAQNRLEQERQNLRERTLALTQAEQVREALQEQLRRRSEDLAQRQTELAEQLDAVQTKEKGLAGQEEVLQAGLAATRTALDARAAELDQQARELALRRQELAQLEEVQRRQVEELNNKSRTLADEARALAEQQTQNQQLWQTRQAELASERSQLEELRRESKALLLELPDVELRAGAALDRLSHARELLRDHLAELHAYVRQSQDDLETTQARLRHESAALTEKDRDLRRLQDEHRVALVGFRQQVLDWQGRIGELQRLLQRGEKGLENRQAKVVEQERHVDAAAQQLVRQGALLEAQQRTVAEQRNEVDRQLVDLRDWYRGKLRELAGIPLDAVGAVEPEADAAVPNDRDILSLTGPIEPGDQRLGDLLREHRLVDADTLHALLVEARRQRRSLRQILLASGAVTVYQLALIETDNVPGLMLGPLRVVDRLRQTGHETLYRVFDPRRGQEALLRHLEESHAQDAVAPDEYRQRFQQLQLAEAHLAATLEVLELAGRPAVLQEWLTGLPASDWPPLAAAPGVCYRLLTQAALGLSALHKHGLVHGRLSEPHLLLTPQGILKLCGAAEPAWLAPGTDETSEPADDLRRLGKIVAGWCTPSGVRKGAKTRPLPDRMVAILLRLQAQGNEGYGSAADLLADLDAASADVPPNPEAWDRLLRYVRDHAMPEATMRRSA